MTFGKEDFNTAVQMVTIPASTENMQMEVTILVNNDEINEPNEGFLVVVTIESASDPQDAANAVFIHNGVSIVTVQNDDSKWNY